jgi:hypothetical protein
VQSLSEVAAQSCVLCYWAVNDPGIGGMHALGLGTCLVGFAVSAMQKDGRIKDLLKIPREEAVHAVIAVGHPAVTYQRLTGRKKVLSRFFEP